MEIAVRFRGETLSRGALRGATTLRAGRPAEFERTEAEYNFETETHFPVRR